MAVPREVVAADVIAARVAAVGARIAADYDGKDLVLVGMLKGATVFVADLLRAVTGQVRYELVNVSQEADARGEVVELHYATHVRIAGCHALILKDICHSGVTENYLLTHLAQHNPASLEIAAVVNKRNLRRVAVEPKYVVIDDVPEGRLVGYGMEYEGRWGNLPGLHVLDGI